MIIIALPLMFNNLRNFFYQILDLVVIRTLNIGSADVVVILDQIRLLILTLGTALALGGFLLIGRKLGAAEFDEAKKISNNIFLMTIILSVSLIIIFIPLGHLFLGFLSTPQHIIDNYLIFFYIQIITTLVMVINSVIYWNRKC